MSYRFRYFLVEEPKKKREPRKPEKVQEQRIPGIDHAIIGNASIGTRIAVELPRLSKNSNSFLDKEIYTNSLVLYAKENRCAKLVEIMQTAEI